MPDLGVKMQIGFLNTKESDVGSRLFLTLSGVAIFCTGLLVALHKQELANFSQITCFLGISTTFFPLISPGKHSASPVPKVLCIWNGIIFLTWFGFVLIYFGVKDWMSLCLGIVLVILGFFKWGKFAGKNNNKTEINEVKASNS